MFRINPVMPSLNIQVANLTKYDLNFSSRLEGQALRITITGPRHGVLVPPDTGLEIATQLPEESKHG